MDFEWDPEKAAANLRKHKIDFHVAIRVFLDPFRLEYEQADDADGQRFNVIGMVEVYVLHVTYTMRGEAYRVIPDRHAERHERKSYHHEG